MEILTQLSFVNKKTRSLRAKFFLPLILALASLEAGAISFGEFIKPTQGDESGILIQDNTDPFKQISSLTFVYDSKSEIKENRGFILNLSLNGENLGDLTVEEPLTLAFIPGKYEILASSKEGQSKKKEF